MRKIERNRRKIELKTPRKRVLKGEKKELMEAT